MTPRLLIVGFGSIGRRHFRNFRALGVHDIAVYRTGHSTLPTDELADTPVYHDLDEALAQQPSAVVVANPTALHVPVALAAARAGCHLLIEKPVSHTLAGLDELEQIVHEKHLQVLVGFQFRFHPGLQHIRHLLQAGAIGPVVSAAAHWGEYLPDWHPWEDYRQSYSARPDLGGGVIHTLSHPLDYLRWLVGEVTTVTALTGSIGLDIPVADTAEINLQFASGATGHVHLDYVQRPPSHWLRITGQQGTIYWDNGDGTVHCYLNGGKTRTQHPITPDFERNALFLDEARHFLACISGDEQPRCTLHDGIQAVRIALAAYTAAAPTYSTRVD